MNKESTELTLSKRTISVRNKAEAIQRLTTSLEDVVHIRTDWLADKRDELARAIEAHKALSGQQVSEARLRYSRNRVSMLRKVVNIIEAGFVPIPRFGADTLKVEFDQLPLKALMAVNDAKASGLFDEIRIIRGAEPIRQPGQRRIGQRDPLLIGIVGMAQADLGRPEPWDRSRILPAREEHFLLAWWRPQDEVDEDMW